MRLLLGLAVAFSLALSSLNFGGLATAYDNNPYTETTVSLSANSIVAATSQAIKITFHCYYISSGNGCGSSIQLEGGPGSSVLEWQPGIASTDPSTGLASFTIRANKSQSTTSTATLYAYHVDGMNTITITIQPTPQFNYIKPGQSSPKSRESSPSSNSGRSSRNEPAGTGANSSENSVTGPAAPSTPGLGMAKLGARSLDPSQTIKIRRGLPTVIGGTTVPYGKLDIYIFSEPQHVAVTADAGGNWTYALPLLALGKHHIEATVTDPTTDLVSARQTIAQLNVSKPKPIATTKPSSNSWLISPIILMALCLIVLADILWKPFLRQNTQLIYKKVKARLSK